MSDGVIRKLLTSALIVLLHLPLIYQASALRATLQPHQDISDLAPAALLVLLSLFLLPHAVLALMRVKWNPQRARLNEYDS